MVQLDHIPVVPKIVAPAGVEQPTPMFPKEQFVTLKGGNVYALCGRFFNPGLMNCQNNTELFEWTKPSMKEFTKDVDYSIKVRGEEVTANGVLKVDQLLDALYPDSKTPPAFFGKTFVYVHVYNQTRADIAKAIGNIVNAEIRGVGNKASITFYNGRVREKFAATLEEYERPGKGFIAQMIKFDHSVITSMSDESIGKLFGGNLTEVTLSDKQVEALDSLLEVSSKDPRSRGGKEFYDQFKTRDPRDPIVLSFVGFGKAEHVYYSRDNDGKKTRVSF